MISKIEFRENEFVEGTLSANATIKFLAKLAERLDYEKENI